MGNFNIIGNDFERRGGHPRHFSTMEEFNSFIDAVGLFDLRFEGISFRGVMARRGGRGVGPG